MIKERKYKTALSLAKGERQKLIDLYENGNSIKEISKIYNSTSRTVTKALVFLGYDGPEWAVDEVKKTLEKKAPSTMKKTNSLV